MSNSESINKNFKSFLLSRIKLLLLIIVLLCHSLPALSQEYIKEAPYIDDQVIGIREVSPNKWMISSRNFFSSFFYISDTSSVVHSMDFLGYEFAINDFEISRNWVYFCGESTDPDDPYAFVGKFQITSFPSSIVYFYRIDRIKTLTKIEVQFGGMGTTNAYMIGQGHNGEWYFVGASLSGFGTTGTFYFSEAIDNHIDILDDIAYTDKYVVATGRKTNVRKGYLYYFYLPALVGGPYATVTQICDIGYDVYNPILIKHCEQDYIVTVSSDNYDHLISAFDSTEWKHFITIARDNSARERDLDYNLQSRELDLLVGNPPYLQQECFSYIYHLSVANIAASPTSLDVHNYTGENICAIENTSEVFPQNNRFVATGGGCITHHLRWYRYNSHLWKGCAEKETKFAYKSKTIFIPEDFVFIPEKIYIDPVILEQRIRQYDYYTICPEKTHISYESE